MKSALHINLTIFSLGDDLGNHLVNGIAIGKEERTNPSLYWLMPKSLMWNDDEVILQSENLNITANNLSKVYILLLPDCVMLILHKFDSKIIILFSIFLKSYSPFASKVNE